MSKETVKLPGVEDAVVLDTLKGQYEILEELLQQVRETRERIEELELGRTEPILLSYQYKLLRPGEIEFGERSWHDIGIFNSITVQFPRIADALDAVLEIEETLAKKGVRNERT